MDADLDRAALKLSRQRKRHQQRKAAFLNTLPSHYPEPRAELEWRAYERLRRWWPRHWIASAIANYGTDEMLLPGSLDGAGRPSYTEYMNDVGLLAEGEYSRTLSDDERFTLLAGSDAARGFKVIEGARLSHEKTHGTKIEKVKRWRKQCAAFDEARRSGHSITAAYSLASEQLGVDEKTIRRAVKKRQSGEF